MANTKIPSELIADSAITAAKLADGTITTADIADSNVTTAKIADSNVTTAKIGDAQVTTAKIVDANVTTVKIADDAVTTAKMASNSVTSDTIASGITLAGTTTLSSHLVMGDNDIIKVGDSSDLQIYHDGSNSYVTDAGDGVLFIKSSAGVYLNGTTTDEPLARFIENGAVNLYYDNSLKFNTTSTGIDVTGTATMDGLTVEGDTLSMSHTGNTSTISLTQKAGTQNSVATISANREDTTTSASRLLFNTNDGTSTLQRMRIANGGDISFYEDTGTTAKLLWDASAETLAIGHTSPSSTYRLDVAGAIRSFGNAPSYTLREDDASSQTWLMASYGGTFALRDTTVSGTAYPFQIQAATPSNTLFLKSDGKVGIGKTPSTWHLDVDSTDGYIASFDGSSNTGIAINSSSGIGDIIGYSNSASSYNKVNIRGASGIGLVVDTSNNVGIGIDSPANPLSISVQTHGLYSQHRPSSGIGVGQEMYYKFNTADGTPEIFSSIYSEIESNTNGAESGKIALRAAKAGTLTTGLILIGSTGNVGIGETSPDTILHIKKNQSSANSSIKLENAAGGNNSSFSIDWQLASSGTSAQIKADRTNSPGAGDTDLIFSTSTTGTSLVEAMRIDNVGEVSIKRAGSGGSGVLNALNLNHAGTSVNDGAKISFTAGTSTEGAGIASTGQALNSADLRFYTGGTTEAMRILSTGQIVTGGLTSTSAALHLYSDNSWSGILTLQSQAAANATAQIAFMSRDSSNVNDDAYIKYNNSGGTTTNQFDFYPSNQRTFSMSRDGSTFYGDTGTNQGIGKFIGSVAPHNAGNRYIHVQLSTNYNEMVHIFVHGYSYTSALIEGACAFYFYNNNNQTTLYDGRYSGSIVAGHCNSSNNYSEIVIDTLGTNTTNRWGNVTIYGGQDNIISYHHTEIVQVSYTNSTARVFT